MTFRHVVYAIHDAVLELVVSQRSFGFFSCLYDNDLSVTCSLQGELLAVHKGCSGSGSFVGLATDCAGYRPELVPIHLSETSRKGFKTYSWRGTRICCKRCGLVILLPCSAYKCWSIEHRGSEPPWTAVCSVRTS